MSGLLANWHKLSKKAQWLTAIGLIFGVFILIGAFSNEDTSSPSSAPADPVTELVEVVDDPFDNESSGQENAREQAENYLDTMAFSRPGLIKQLKFEGYSTADATYAVDNITVDWKEQAAKAAQNYLDTMPFSRSELLQQLRFEGYTTAQAEYGVSVAY